MPYLCDEKKREYKRQYYLKNKEKIKKRSKERYERTKVLKGRTPWTDEYTKEYMAKYQEENKERIAEKRKEWRKNNKDKIMAQKARRRARKLNATPNWLTEEDNKEILSFYTEAQRLQNETGEKYHVDHIVPLLGDGGCGLHVPWNLQVLTEEENLKKGISY